MSAALQIAYSEFDRDFFSLAAQVQKRINAKIDQMGLRLRDYPHYRMKGSERFRLRVGDYRGGLQRNKVRRVHERYSNFACFISAATRSAAIAQYFSDRSMWT